MPHELAVQRGDLRPVELRLLGLQRRDRGLEHVRAAAAQRQRPLEQRAPLVDLRGVPQRAVLILEQDELAAGNRALAARVVQQHQREQPEHLGLVGHQRRQHPAQADRFGADRPRPR